MGAERALGVIGAILGGYASGQLAGEERREDSRRQMYQTALNVAQVRSQLESQIMQRQALAQQMEQSRLGFETPGQQRGAELEQRRASGLIDIDLGELERQRMTQEQAGREQTFMQGLPAMMSRQAQTTPRALNVAFPQQEPGRMLSLQQGEPRGLTGLAARAMSSLAQPQQPPAVGARNVTLPPTDPMARAAFQNDMPLTVTMGATGQPTVSSLTLPSQSEREAQQRAGTMDDLKVRSAELELQMLTEMMPFEIMSAQDTALLANLKLQVAEATTPAEIEAIMADARMKLSEEARGAMQDQIMETLLTSENPEEQQMGIYMLNGWSMSRSESDYGPTRAALEERGQDVDLALAQGRERVAQINAEGRAVTADIAGRWDYETALVRESGRSQPGRPGVAPSDEEAREAYNDATEILYKLVEDAQAGEDDVSIMAHVDRLADLSRRMGPWRDQYIETYLRIGQTLQRLGQEDVLIDPASGQPVTADGRVPFEWTQGERGQIGPRRTAGPVAAGAFPGL